MSNAVIEAVAKALFAETHEESWEEAEELTRRIYLDEAPAGIAAVLDHMPREAMARAILEISGFDWRTSKGPRRTTTLGWVDAALSAARAVLLPGDA